MQYCIDPKLYLFKELRYLIISILIRKIKDMKTVIYTEGSITSDFFDEHVLKHHFSKGLKRGHSSASSGADSELKSSQLRASEAVKLPRKQNNHDFHYIWVSAWYHLCEQTKRPEIERLRKLQLFFITLPPRSPTSAFFKLFN